MSETCDTNEYLDCCLYFTANNMSRMINKMAEEAFMPTGLAPSYAFLMMVLIEEKSLSSGQLAHKLHLAPSTVSRFVDKLIVKGFVEKESVGKVTNVRPTKKGAQLLTPIRTAWKSLYVSYCDVLGEEFAVKLTADMAKANKNLEI